MMMYLFALSPPIHVSHNQPLLVLCATYREGISWESVCRSALPVSRSRQGKGLERLSLPTTNVVR